MNGINLYYETAGTGRPLILLHGGLGAIEMFGPNLAALVWLWAAIGASVVLQLAAVYVPFLHQAFGTVAISRKDWLLCATVASSVLWLRELSKILSRAIGAA